jgi:acyl dehydratase
MLSPMTTSALGPDFAAPIDDRWFEDYAPGAVYEYGSVTLDEASILAFAREFDPQPFHVDPAGAVDGPFGGLIASGWHTAGVMMRLLADHFISKPASLASPGVDELRWRLPVRPGDSLRVRTSILEARPSRSTPDRGVVRTLVEVLNQRHEVVMSVVPVNLLRTRPPGGDR